MVRDQDERRMCRSMTALEQQIAQGVSGVVAMSNVGKGKKADLWFKYQLA